MDKQSDLKLAVQTNQGKRILERIDEDIIKALNNLLQTTTFENFLMARGKLLGLIETANAMTSPSKVCFNLERK